MAVGTEVVVRGGTLAGMAGLLINCDDVERCLVRLIGKDSGVYLAIAMDQLTHSAT